MRLLTGKRIIEFDRPLVMGILNVTPDSFFDGGKYADAADAVDSALRMEAEGADIIDIGGESSRPGSVPVTPDEEASRIIPVIEKLSSRLTIPISVDTYRASTAAQAIAAGAEIINDISALRFDTEMAPLIARTGVSVVLMHMQETPQTMQQQPQYTDVVLDIHDFLAERITFAAGMGIARDHVIIDPGIGFGKTLDHNLELLRRIELFHDLGCPLLIGASRKRMYGMLTGAPPEERHWGTAAVTAWCTERGVQIHRVHDVSGIRQVCDMIAALKEEHSLEIGR